MFDKNTVYVVLPNVYFLSPKTGGKQARKNKTDRVKAWNLECANVGTDNWQLRV